MASLTVYCADIGSVANGRFGWARVTGDPPSTYGDTEIKNLVARVAADLERGGAVCLGFECPLFVPLADDPDKLTKARPIEGNRPWSAGAGCGALATGLVEVPWVLQRVRESVGRDADAFLDWSAFREAGRGLFLWEAFVSGDAKPCVVPDGTSPHVADAIAGAEYFLTTLDSIADQNVEPSDSVYSLIGAAMLRTGWSTDLELLRSPCAVSRVPAVEAAR